MKKNKGLEDNVYVKVSCPSVYLKSLAYSNDVFKNLCCKKTSHKMIYRKSKGKKEKKGEIKVAILYHHWSMKKFGKFNKNKMTHFSHIDF